jgi:TnpA family transposase
MDVEKQYVDTHGQSEVGFAFCYLLGFALLPRLKNIKKQRLYRPYKGEPEKYANLQPILTRPINWEIIEQQYDQLIKFATALRLGTADAQSILRRFTKSNVQHPTYKALCELGKALKTMFLCEYLQLEPAAARDSRGLERGRELEQRQRLHPIRQRWRVRQQPVGGSGDSDARVAFAASEPRIREHADDSAGAGGAGMAGPPQCG